MVLELRMENAKTVAPQNGTTAIVAELVGYHYKCVFQIYRYNAQAVKASEQDMSRFCLRLLALFKLVYSNTLKF